MATTAPYGALTLRLALGVATLAHGLLKLLVFTPAGTAAYFTSIGLPSAAAYLVMLAEIGGGIALILGAYTRVVALALVPVLLGATWTHAGNGWLFTAPNGGWEYPAFWTVALLAQALLGGGAYALRLPNLVLLAGRRAAA